jgi:hypothetical protein
MHALDNLERKSNCNFSNLFFNLISSLLLFFFFIQYHSHTHASFIRYNSRKKGGNKKKNSVCFLLHLNFRKTSIYTNACMHVCMYICLCCFLTQRKREKIKTFFILIYYIEEFVRLNFFESFYSGFFSQIQYSFFFCRSLGQVGGALCQQWTSNEKNETEFKKIDNSLR